MMYFICFMFMAFVLFVSIVFHWKIFDKYASKTLQTKDGYSVNARSILTSYGQEWFGANAFSFITEKTSKTEKVPGTIMLIVSHLATPFLLISQPELGFGFLSLVLGLIFFTATFISFHLFFNLRDSFHGLKEKVEKTSLYHPKYGYYVSPFSEWKKDDVVSYINVKEHQVNIMDAHQKYIDNETNILRTKFDMHASGHDLESRQVRLAYEDGIRQIKKDADAIYERNIAYFDSRLADLIAKNGEAFFKDCLPIALQTSPKAVKTVMPTAEEDLPIHILEMEEVATNAQLPEAVRNRARQLVTDYENNVKAREMESEVEKALLKIQTVEKYYSKDAVTE